MDSNKRLSHHLCPPERKLSSGNFNGFVRLQFEDGSTATFEYAFAEKIGDLIHVYTEHCGYHSFRASSLEKCEFYEYSSSRSPEQQS
jgi:hypothetical protein